MRDLIYNEGIPKNNAVINDKDVLERLRNMSDGGYDMNLCCLLEQCLDYLGIIESILPRQSM